MRWTRRWTRRPHPRSAGAVTALALLGGALAAPAADAVAPYDATARTERLTDLVNPFIGTANEGNTYPGAAVPFGMVQLSPDTGHNTGYDHADTRIRGFSAVHLSGVGCRIGGDLPVLPTTGDITATDNARYAVPFRHTDEAAGPGYYRVGLGNGVRAELTASRRTGVQRYTFPATDRANVLLNAGQALHRNRASAVEILDDRTIRTSITGSGFCQATEPYTVHTLTRFDRPFTAYGTWQGATVTDGSTRAAATTGRSGAWVRFDTRGDRTVEATTALSYVDARGAARNLRAEGGRSFSRVRQAARAAWEDRLHDVRAHGGDRTLRRTFYSSLYRSFLAPNTGSDTDGRYRGWDGRVHRARGFTYYQNWSLWDTYRTQAQLLALLAPRESRDMALSVLRVGEEGGWLPKWGYGTVETNIMTGDPVTPSSPTPISRACCAAMNSGRTARCAATPTGYRRPAHRPSAARPTPPIWNAGTYPIWKAARTPSPATPTTTTGAPPPWSTRSPTRPWARWPATSATTPTPAATRPAPATTARCSTRTPASSDPGTATGRSQAPPTRPAVRASTRAPPGSTSGSSPRTCRA